MRLHAFCHESFQIWIDGPIFCRDGVEAGLRAPRSLCRSCRYELTDTNGFQHGIGEVEPDVHLHYVQAGQGAKTIVLIHGYPETWWEWRHVMPIFASAGYRVIAVDYRGAGNSSKPASGYDKRTMAQDIHSLLVNHLAVTDPIIMVGHDIGMTVAFAFATIYPAKVSELVLVDAILPGTPTFRAFLTTGKLRNSNLAHFFWHNS